MDKNKNITTFEEHLEKRYGKIGTKRRTDFDIKAKAFAIGEIIKDERKQAKISRAAAMFLGMHPGLSDCRVRFDVIAFDRPESDPCELQWIRDAFRS